MCKNKKTVEEEYIWRGGILYTIKYSKDESNINKADVYYKLPKDREDDEGYEILVLELARELFDGFSRANKLDIARSEIRIIKQKRSKAAGKREKKKRSFQDKRDKEIAKVATKELDNRTDDKDSLNPIVKKLADRKWTHYDKLGTVEEKYVSEATIRRAIKKHLPI